MATHRLTYVGSDPDAVRDIYREHFGFGQYEPNEGFCGTGSSLILLKPGSTEGERASGCG